MLRSRIAAGVLAACCGCGVVGAQIIEFRIVEREGQTAITTTADAELNLAVQARLVGGAPGEAIGFFGFDMVIVDESDAFGTLARGLTSNVDGTYATDLAISSVPGQGGLPRQFAYFAAINSVFNGTINTSVASFMNSPQQEIGLVTGIASGTNLIDTPGIDTDMDGNPDTYPGSGEIATLDPTAGATYFGVGGGWIDVYRFRYTVTHFSSRNLIFQIYPVSAGTFTQLRRNANQWGLGATSARPTAANPTTVRVEVSDSGACCDLSGTCSTTIGAMCTGSFLVGGSCSPSPCIATGSCCTSDGSCRVAAQIECVGAWQDGVGCTPNTCAQPGACCTATGTCSLLIQSACRSGVWISGATCMPNACDQPGACCGVDCQFLTAQACSSGRTWMAGTCSPNPCPSPLACCNPQTGACVLAIPVANVEYQYAYTRGITSYARNDSGGTVESIAASFDSTTKRLVFDVRLSSSTSNGIADTTGFWLVLNNGPDPKGRPGELAIFYFDASVLASPVLTVYGYNGADAGTSWLDGDPAATGDQAGDLIKGAHETGYIHSLVAENVTVGTETQRRFKFDIDASDIIEHVPMYPAATPWVGTGFDRGLGIWLHPARTFVTSYESSAGGQRGRITSLLIADSGWLDANYRTTMNNDPCTSQFTASPGGTCSPTSTCPQQRACCNPNTGACILVAPSSDCLAGYLFASPSTNTCSPSPCLVLARQATGACCSVLTGACWLLPESSCTTGTHQWQAESVCDPNPCPPAQGACCNVVTGTCTVKAQATCGVNAHDWLAGRTCGPGTCDVPGICCNAATGACRRLTEARCESPNAWSPEGVCSPNPCGTIGRCCNVYTGACQMTTRAACGPMAHDWMPGSTCAPNPCDVPGACCNDTVGACGRLTRSRCGPQNAWTAGAVCSPNPCQLVGKCCNVRTGACRVVVKSSCPSARNDWSPSGVCGPEACVQPGVCCIIATGACRMLTEDRCGSASVWLPSGTCTPNPCSVPRGACCNVVTGTCAVTTHAACAPAAHDWFAGGVCTPNSCERPAACCNPDSGSCRRLTENRCMAVGGVWLSSQTCGPSVCGVALAQGCPADFDGSGEIDIQDLLTFVNAWFAMDARADFRVSGELDITDIFDYLNAWLAGC